MNPIAVSTEAESTELGSTRAGSAGTASPPAVSATRAFPLRVLDLLGAERVKLLSTRSFWWCSGLTLVLVVGLAGLVGALADGAPLDGSEFVGMGLLVVLVAAATTVTGEYRHGTIRTTFQAVPNRHAALPAKATVAALAAGGLGLVAGFGARGAAWLTQRGAELGLTTSAQWREVAGVSAVFAIAAVLAVAVAILLRSAVGSISLLLGWVLVVESTIGLIPRVGPELQRWMPFGNGTYFLHAGQPEPGRPLFGPRMPFGPWGSLAYFAGIAAAVLVVALLVANRRDA